MADRRYIGNAPLVQKSIRMSPPSGPYPSTLQIGFKTGPFIDIPVPWSAATIASRWNNTDHALMKEITAAVSGTDVVFQHSTSGSDFHIIARFSDAPDDALAYLSSESTITFGHVATGGTVTLGIFAETTAAITYVPANTTTTAANIQAGLIALTALAIGDVVVTWVSGTTYKLVWGGKYEGLDVAVPIVNYVNLTGGDASVVIAMMQTGNADQNAIQTVVHAGDLGAIDGGVQTWVLQKDDDGATEPVTVQLAYNTSAAAVVTAINTAAGATIVSATGGAHPGIAIAVTFINTWGAQPILPIVVTTAFGDSLQTAVIVREKTSNAIRSYNRHRIGIIPGKGSMGIVPAGDTSVGLNHIHLGINRPISDLEDWQKGWEIVVKGRGPTQRQINFVLLSYEINGGGETGPIPLFVVNEAAMVTSSTTLEDSINSIPEFSSGPNNVTVTWTWNKAERVFKITPAGAKIITFRIIGYEAYETVKAGWSIKFGAVTNTITFDDAYFGLAWLSEDGEYFQHWLGEVEDAFADEPSFITYAGGVEGAINTIVPFFSNDPDNYVSITADWDTKTLNIEFGDVGIMEESGLNVQNLQDNIFLVGAVEHLVGDAHSLNDYIYISEGYVDFGGPLESLMITVRSFLIPAGPVTSIISFDPTGVIPPGDASASMMLIPGLIHINWIECTAGRIERAINEYFGREVCYVTQVKHSQKPDSVVIGTLSGSLNVLFGLVGTQLNGWYNHDEYDITFINDMGEPGSIASFELIDSLGFPVYGIVTPPEGKPANDLTNPNRGPNLHHVLEGFAADGVEDIGEIAPNQFGEFWDESERAERLTWFRTLLSSYKVEWTDPEEAGIDGVETMNELTYRFKFISKYVDGMGKGEPEEDGLTPSYVGIAYTEFPRIIDNTEIQFVISRKQWIGVGSAPAETLLHLTEWMDSDSPVELIQNTFSKLLSNVPGPFVYGVGNIAASGSLYGSWLAEDHEAYSDLRIRFTGNLSLMQLHKLGYSIEMNVRGTADYTSSSDNFFKLPLPWGDIADVPGYPIRTYREKVAIPTGGSTLLLTLYNPVTDADEVYSLTTGMTVDRHPTEGTTSNDASCKINGLNSLVRTKLLTDKLGRAWMLYGIGGSTIADCSHLVIDWSGLWNYKSEWVYDAHKSTMSVLLDMTTTVVTTQVGRLARSTIQSVTLSNLGEVIRGGSGVLTIPTYGDTAGIAFNATSVSVNSAVDAVSGVTCTSALLDPTGVDTWNGNTVIVTFNSSMGAVSLMTAVDTFVNSNAVMAETQGGGIASLPIMNQSVPGSGPAFFMLPQNWEDQIVAGSQDRVVIDQCNAPVKYDIDLLQEFKVVAQSDITQFVLACQRAVFVENQKVWVESDTTLPTGMTEQYYFIKEPSDYGTFYLAEAVDDLEVDWVKASDLGAGIHRIGLRELKFLSYARYAGAVVGLSKLRLGLPEYLPQYMHAWFQGIVIGDNTLGGTGLSLGRFDSDDSDVTDGIEVILTQSGSEVPAVLFLIHNDEVVLTQRDGSVGIAVYDGETSNMKSIQQTGTSAVIVVANTTTTDPSNFKGITTFRNVQLASVSNIP